MIQHEREQARRTTIMAKELADTQAALQRATDELAAEKRITENLRWSIRRMEQNSPGTYYART